MFGLLNNRTTWERPSRSQFIMGHPGGCLMTKNTALSFKDPAFAQECVSLSSSNLYQRSRGGRSYSGSLILRLKWTKREKVSFNNFHFLTKVSVNKQTRGGYQKVVLSKSTGNRVGTRKALSSQGPFSRVQRAGSLQGRIGEIPRRANQLSNGLPLRAWHLWRKDSPPFNRVEGSPGSN